MDAHTNLAYSTVAVAPSPNTSGTSLTVATGHGSRFPAVPFNAVIWPISDIPNPANAEIVRVTNITGDVLTITRTQESTSARAVIVGDQIGAAATAKTFTDIEAQLPYSLLSTTGDLIYASAANVAARRALSVPAANVLNVLAVANGETVPSWKAVLDGTAPADVAESAVAGTSLIAAHRDHVHSGSAYAILAGRSGGQTLKGGTAASETLTLQSTNHATKGKILFGPGGNYLFDESTNRMGLGTSTPQAPLVVADAGASGLEVFPQKQGGGAGTYLQSYNRASPAYVSAQYVAYDHAFYYGGNLLVTFANDGSLVVGAPTGGAKGAGTINATAVYDDNVLLTCPALQAEFIESGTIDLEKWDALVPDLVIPESVVDTPSRIVGTTGAPLVQSVKIPEQVIPRRHETAHLFAQMVADGFDPRDPVKYFAKLRADAALPGMPSLATWEHNALSSGELFSRMWLASEFMALVLMNHEERIAALER